MSPEFRPEQPSEDPQQETELVIPAKRMRPHHAFNRHIQDALLRRVPPQQIAAEYAGGLFDLQAKGDPAGYYNDVLRKTYRDFYTFELDAWEYFNQLGESLDNSLLHLDLEPDGLCNISREGMHCMATNVVTLYDNPKDTPEAETRAVSHIANALGIAGYGDETYAFRQTKHKLFDYEGQKLNECPRGKLTFVTFNSMIVNTGALRDIMQRGLLESY